MTEYTNTIHMEAIKKIENLAAGLTMSQTDGYSQILRICEAINNNEKNLEAFGNNNQREIRFMDKMAGYSSCRKMLKRRAENILKLYVEKGAGFSFYYEAGKWKPVYLENRYDIEKYHIWLRFYEIHSEDTRDSYPFEDMTVVPLEELPEGTTLEYVAEISWHEDDGTFMGRIDMPLSIFVGASWKQYLSELLDKEVEISLEMFADPNWKQNIEDLLTEGESILKLRKEELERKEKEEEESKEYEEYLRLAQKYGAGK
mgnify:CR=1 FL=1